MRFDASDFADLRPLIVEAVRATVEELTAAGRLGPRRGDDPPPLLLTVKQAAVTLCCSGRTIANMVARRELAAVRIGNNGGAVRIDRRDIEAWIERTKKRTESVGALT